MFVATFKDIFKGKSQTLHFKAASMDEARDFARHLFGNRLQAVVKA